MADVEINIVPAVRRPSHRVSDEARLVGAKCGLNAPRTSKGNDRFMPAGEVHHRANELTLEQDGTASRLRMFEHRSNAFIEAMNGLLQQAKRPARA